MTKDCYAVAHVQKSMNVPNIGVVEHYRNHEPPSGIMLNYRIRLGSLDKNYIRQRDEYINHIFSYDFVMDICEDGSRLKIPAVAD